MWAAAAAAAAVVRGRRGAGGGGFPEPFQLMVPTGIRTHLLASPNVACRWLGFGAPPAAIRPDAHEEAEHGLLMSLLMAPTAAAASVLG